MATAPRPTAIAVLALGLALGGCSSGGKGPAAPGGSPSADPTVVYTCTPEGGTPTPCTPEQYTVEQAQLTLAEDAKGIYQKLFTELAALQRAGGAPTPSPELTTRAGGPYLAAQVAQLTKLSQLQAKMSGDVKLTTLRPAPGAAARGFDTALVVCVDATKAKVVQGGKALQSGQLIAETVYFRRDGDNLKAWDAEKLDPKSC